MIQMIDDDRCCLNCRFWKTQTESTNWGRCHRYPPQFWSEGEESGAAFVGTNGGDWCGEHKPNERWVLPEGFVMVDEKGNEIGKT